MPPYLMARPASAGVSQRRLSFIQARCLRATRCHPAVSKSGCVRRGFRLIPFELPLPERSGDASQREGSGCPTSRWSRPGQPEVTKYAILALAGRAAHLRAVRRPAPTDQRVSVTVFHPKGLISLDDLKLVKERHDQAMRDIAGLTFGALILVWAAFATDTLVLIPIALICWVAGFLFLRRRTDPLGLIVLRTDPLGPIILGDASKGSVTTHRFSPAKIRMARKVQHSALSVEGIREAFFMKCSSEGVSRLIPYALVLSVTPDRPAKDIVRDLIAISPIVRNKGVSIWPLLPNEELLPHMRKMHAAFYGATEK